MACDLTVRQWGDTLGVSRQRAYKIVKRCGIPLQDGKVDSSEATRIWREQKDHLQASRGLSPAAVAANGAKANETPDNPESSPAEPEADAEPEPQDTSFGEAQRLREWVRLKREKLDIEERERRLIPRSEVIEKLGNLVITAKTNLRGIGAKIAPDLAIETDAAKIQAVVDSEVDAALGTISQWAPA